MTNKSKFRMYLEIFNLIPVFCLHDYVPIDSYKKIILNK
jgi:hypothetical protein